MLCLFWMKKTFTDSVVLHAVLNTKEAGDINTPKITHQPKKLVWTSLVNSILIFAAGQWLLWWRLQGPAWPYHQLITRSFRFETHSIQISFQGMFENYQVMLKKLAMSHCYVFWPFAGWNHLFQHFNIYRQSPIFSTIT